MLDYNAQNIIFMHNYPKLCIQILCYLKEVKSAIKKPSKYLHVKNTYSWWKISHQKCVSCKGQHYNLAKVKSCLLPSLHRCHSRWDTAGCSGKTLEILVFECLNILNVRTDFKDVNDWNIKQLQTAHQDHSSTSLICYSFHSQYRAVCIFHDIQNKVYSKYIILS